MFFYSLQQVELILCCIICWRFQSLQALQDTEASFNRGNELIDQGNFAGALECCLQTMWKLDDILCAPYRDYIQCQERARRCILTLGNVIYAPDVTNVRRWWCFDKEFINWFNIFWNFFFICQRRQSTSTHDTKAALKNTNKLTQIKKKTKIGKKKGMATSLGWTPFVRWENTTQKIYVWNTKCSSI